MGLGADRRKGPELEIELGTAVWPGLRAEHTYPFGATHAGTGLDVGGSGVDTALNLAHWTLAVSNPPGILLTL